ncbi:hypothetical protein FOA43_001361 [Brettanomyces nanus]|uniref:Uncharacterized protein n=1 Tax=Eeniella nana TaxID=13502 RepID=A0A875S1R7_EENNA|nr:uncharacterized protein FOA43_001361 [Brettanomyces nanus]QPG74042.1 hypothetical protein FOA43_001361 [Brettanomyces nanus]
MPTSVSMLARDARLIRYTFRKSFKPLTFLNIRLLTTVTPDSSSTTTTKLSGLTATLNDINRKSAFYPPNVVKINSKEDIVQTFLKLASLDDPASVPVPLGDSDWLNLFKEKQSLKELPEAPKNLNSVKLDSYIEQLSHLQTRTNKKLRDAVQKVYWTIVESHLVQNVESYNRIIRFFVVNYNFNAVKVILFSMFKAGVKPNINTFNCVLYQLKYAKHKYKDDLFKMYLNQMKAYRLKPDTTTWYILFNFLDLEKPLFYDQMLKVNISLKPVINEVLEFQHKFRDVQVDALVVYLESQNLIVDKKILTTLIRICLKDEDPSKAFELLDKYIEQIHHVDFNSLISLVNYFALEKKQLYNAIATINWFMDHYDLRIKVYRCYEILAKSMMEYPYFDHWSTLTRRFYLDSMYAVDQSLLSKNDRKLISRCAITKYGIKDFHLGVLKRSEFDETMQVFQNLRWSSGKPRPVLEENDPSFIQAAKYLVP